MGERADLWQDRRHVRKGDSVGRQRGRDICPLYMISMVALNVSHLDRICCHCPMVVHYPKVVALSRMIRHKRFTAEVSTSTYGVVLTHNVGIFNVIFNYLKCGDGVRVKGK